MELKSCPLTGREVLTEYFLENRARLIEIAAYLDRLTRAQDPAEAEADPRHGAFLDALQVLLDPAAVGERAARVQRCFSDPTTEPIASAAGLKGAIGAWPGRAGRSA